MSACLIIYFTAESLCSQGHPTLGVDYSAESISAKSCWPWGRAHCEAHPSRPPVLSTAVTLDHIAISQMHPGLHDNSPQQKRGGVQGAERGRVYTKVNSQGGIRQ